MIIELQLTFVTQTKNGQAITAVEPYSGACHGFKTLFACNCDIKFSHQNSLLHCVPHFFKSM